MDYRYCNSIDMLQQKYDSTEVIQTTPVIWLRMRFIRCRRIDLRDRRGVSGWVHWILNVE